jgi:hypothetical protein
MNKKVLEFAKITGNGDFWTEEREHVLFVSIVRGAPDGTFYNIIIAGHEKKFNFDASGVIGLWGKWVDTYAGVELLVDKCKQLVFNESFWICMAPVQRTIDGEANLLKFMAAPLGQKELASFSWGLRGLRTDYVYPFFNFWFDEPLQKQQILGVRGFLMFPGFIAVGPGVATNLWYDLEQEKEREKEAMVREDKPNSSDNAGGNGNQIQTFPAARSISYAVGSTDAVQDRKYKSRVEHKVETKPGVFINEDEANSACIHYRYWTAGLPEHEKYFLKYAKLKRDDLSTISARIIYKRLLDWLEVKCQVGPSICTRAQVFVPFDVATQVIRSLATSGVLKEPFSYLSTAGEAREYYRSHIEEDLFDTLHDHWE